MNDRENQKEEENGGPADDRSRSDLRVGLISLYVMANNGVRFLAANLRQGGFQTFEFYLKDFEYHHYVPPTARELELLFSLLRDNRIGLVGISLRAGAYLKLAIELTRRIRQELGIPVMWGGTHVTMAPEDCLGHPDFLVLGEADTVVVEIARAVAEGRDVATISNVMLRRGEEVIRNPMYFPPDLDALPLRDYQSHQFKFWIDRNRLLVGEPMLDERLYLMITSRGCLFHCSYCNVSNVGKMYQNCSGYFRYHSVAAVMAELEQARRIFPGLKRVRFDDQIFIPDRQWIEEFVREYPRRIGLPFEVLSDPRIWDDWMTAALASAGLDRTLTGIQSAESANRRLYNRPVREEKLLAMARSLRRHNVTGSFQVIIDDPEVTRTEKEHLLELLLQMPRPYELYIFSLCHWPNTDRTRRLLEAGIISRDEVEGRNGKAINQFLADFDWPRPAEDNFFLALYQLANKRPIPSELVRLLSRSEWLRKHPEPLILAARTMSRAKFIAMGVGMVARGEVAPSLLRRWFHVLLSPSI